MMAMQLACACGRTADIADDERDPVCPACAAPLRPRRKHRSKPLRPVDWVVCLLLPPAGLLMGLWSVARGHPHTGGKRIAVSLVGLALYAAVYVLLTLANAMPSSDQILTPAP